MNLQEICFAAKLVVEETGAFIMGELGKVQEKEIEDKDRNSFVSYVDKEAEKQLVKGLNNILPAATFLTEEGTVEQKEGNQRWIIDPLDGTTNFLHQIPVFSTSVGLEYQGEIVVGIVFDMNRSECFYAWRGGGAYLNGKLIKVNQNNLLSNALLASAFPARFPKLKLPYFEVMDELMSRSRGIRRLGSAAIDLAYVACGRFDGYFEFGLSPWDVAAGILLIKEAGGKTSAFRAENNELFDGEILATNGFVHDELIQLFKLKF